MKKLKQFLPLILILILAFIFRFYGLNWDSGHHLHPDERFLTMVLTAIKIPKNLATYLNPQISPLNPYNAGYNFFVYGTLPLNLTKIVGETLNLNNYGTFNLVGRALSAIFDIGTVFLLFIIGQKLFNRRTGLLTSFLYTIMVLPIQLSHFFTTDPFLNFFLLLSFYFLILILKNKYHQKNSIAIALAISFGLALACKISALYFSPIIALVFIITFFRNKNKKLKLVIAGLLFIIFSALTFRLSQPTAFSTKNFLNWRPNPQFVKNLKELQHFSDPESWFPPSVQWKDTTPIIFPLKNLILWGLGLPLGVLFLIAFIKNIINLCQKNIPLLLAHLWIIILLIYQGSQFTKTMRYFLPLYPYIALITATFTINSKILKKKYFKALFFFLLFIYPLSFLSIYSRPITRLTASRWIYQNIPAGSTLATEHWDDGLPLNIPGHLASDYPNQSLALYGSDTTQKWQEINRQLDLADYIILSSNRLYGSIPRNPKHYPQTTQYYQDLFAGNLDFTQVAQFASRPCFPPIGKSLFCFPDDNAEEAFTVYDHPKVLIFKKNR